MDSIGTTTYPIDILAPSVKICPRIGRLISQILFVVFSFGHQPHEVDFVGTTVMVPGIEDDNYVNFDHVPVWYEPVGNNLWGGEG